MESLDFGHERCLHTLLAPKEGGEDRLKTAPAPGQLPATTPMCQVNTPAPLASQLSSTLRSRLSCEAQGRIRSEVASGQGGAAITGACSVLSHSGLSDSLWSKGL